MIKRNSVVFAIGILLIISFISHVEAQKFTASLGNSRMILNLEPGESIRKSVLVKNVNDVSVKIDIDVSGELAEQLKLDEKSFELAAGEEKKAYFTIKASNKAGTSEAKINVRFTPEKGNGAGLFANIIVIVSENGVGEDEITSEEISGNEEDTGFSFNPTGQNVALENTGVGKFSTTTLLLIATGILFVVFVALVVYVLKSKKRSGRTS